ncbi:MAG: biotin--[acetyl-CoA-carboxylase] ligase [Thermoplasmata archaeon]|nr:biotin--[acetyl-CoA-carboxylase] ligase [Thermoplasmata archaeon]
MNQRFLFDSLASTQDHASELVRSGAPSGTRVVARSQSRGRGRSDHGWVSPPGGLYLSLVLPDLAEPDPFLSLAAAACLRRALSEGWGVRTRIKWPNDVVAAEGAPRKIAGLLPERIAGPHDSKLVLGLGLNVLGPPEGFPPELLPQTAWLSEFLGEPPGLDALEGELAPAFESLVSELGSSRGRERWLAEYREALYGRGKRAEVNGLRVGRVKEVGPEGELWVEGTEGLLAIRSGRLAIEEAE